MTDSERDRVARAGLWFTRTATSSANLYYETRHARMLSELSRVPHDILKFFSRLT
jgi:hypothetical protein